MGYITGQNRNQMILFPESIDEYVKEDSTVRVIDAYVDSLTLEGFGFKRIRPAATGRPPYSSADLLKLFIYGYINRIRSSRRIEAETYRNLEVMWLIGKLTPDHKTIAQFRSDNSKSLKRVFRDFVKFCNELGLYGKELAAIDGSKFEAVNSNDRNFNDEKLKERIARIDTKIDEYMNELEKTDQQESLIKEDTSVPKILVELQQRKERYETYRQELKDKGETQISQTDPESKRMISNGRSDMCYNVQSSVDSKHKLVIEFSVTSDCNDTRQLYEMTAASAEILGVESLSSVADKGYDSASEIAACIMAGYTPQVIGADYDICLEANEPNVNGEPTNDEEITEHQNGRCVYLRDRNIVLCPMGKVLYPSSYQKSNGSAAFRNGRECSKCSCKCTDEKYKRFEVRMARSEFTKEYNDKSLRIRQLNVRGDKEIMRQRKSLVEHPFGTLKRGMDAGYLLTKGITKVTGELSLSFLAYNIKRVINILGAKKLITAIMNRKKENVTFEQSPFYCRYAA